MSQPKFAMGQIVITRAAQDALVDSDIQAALARHNAGDWGDLSLDDTAANDAALIAGDRLLSCYHDRRGIKFWVLTEADRSSTCVLLPDDY